MNNPTWTIIRKRLRLVSLSERRPAQSSGGNRLKKPRTDSNHSTGGRPTHQNQFCDFCKRSNHRIDDCRDKAKALDLLSAHRAARPANSKPPNGSKSSQPKVKSITNIKSDIIVIYPDLSQQTVSNNIMAQINDGTTHTDSKIMVDCTFLQ
jgi:hypothetical protein